jgi:hypothetical protein
MKPHVHLHIDRLVLDGLGTFDREAVGAAVEAELARLLAQQGAPPALRHDARFPRLDGGHFDVVPGASAEDVGQWIARGVYGGLRR